jgi:hypothetical protein
MSNDTNFKVPEPRAKKTRRPRALSAAATESASNLKNVNQTGLLEMHRNIKRTVVGNHELVASAARAAPPPPPESTTSTSVAHSRELTRIIYEGGLKQIGVDHQHIENCCEMHAGRFEVPQTDEERDALARKVANKSLMELYFEMLSTLKREQPQLKKEEAAAQVSARVDDELHRLQHLYELAHGIPGIDTVEQRYKAWLGVRPGITQNELEAELREEHPSERPSRISGMARTQMAAEERKKTSAFQTHVSDDKVQNMLLQAYTHRGDIEARDIYVEFRKRQIQLQATSAQEAQQRTEEMLVELEARVEAARKQSTKADALSAAAAMQSVAANETRTAVAGVDERTGNQVTAEGVPVESGVHGHGVYLRAYNQDLSAPPEKIRASHCAAMVSELMSAINLMAEMLTVAPPDAVFDKDDTRSGDAIDNLYEMLQEGDSDNDVGRLSSETLHLYIDHWQHVQAESQSDIDRELVRAHRHEEREAVVAKMSEAGVSAAQISTDLAFGVRPEMSQIYRAIAAVAHKDQFALARSEAAEISKFQQRLDQQATAMAREINRNAAEEAAAANSAASDGPSAKHRKIIDKDGAMSLIFEAAARRLPVTTRRYRADFLREPAGPEFLERQCVKGDLCVARVKRSVFPAQSHTQQATSAGGSTKLVNNGFICREFLLPAQLAEAEATGKLPTTIRMCLLCNVYYTSQSVAQYAEQPEGCEERETFELLQDHCIKVGEAGEYTPESSLTLTYRKGKNKKPILLRHSQAYNDGNWVYSHTERHGKRLKCVVETDGVVFRLPSSSATPT